MYGVLLYYVCRYDTNFKYITFVLYFEYENG